MSNLNAALIETTVGIAALCAACILRMSALRPGQLIDALPRLIGSLRIMSAVGSCDGCHKQQVVHRRH